ncbi:integral membrane protein [Usnea florida]
MSHKHPLQRLPSPALASFSALIHIIGLSSFLSSFKYLSDNPNPINDSYGWHFQYLTIIGLTLALLTFTTGLLADLALSPALFRLKNTLSICTTPLQVLISILYWSLRLVDKSLVVPDWAQLPLTADLSFHAVPSILLTADLLLFSPPWTVSAPQAFAISGTLAFLYWPWVETCAAHNGFYPYPIFDMVGSKGRVGLFTLSALVMTGSTVMLKALYNAVNGTEGGSGASQTPERNTPLDESGLPEAVSGVAKEANYVFNATKE